MSGAAGASCRRVALVFQPMAEGAERLARTCAAALADMGAAGETCSSAELTPDRSWTGLDLVVTFGGDGTILRAARWLAGHPVPVVGVRMGRLGFLAELVPSEVPAGLRPYVEGDWWPDRRSMLTGAIGTRVAGDTAGTVGPAAAEPFLALNDVVVGRGPSPRTVAVDLTLDGQLLHQFRCDGLIVATATGSTAYSFAAGGPILAPESRDVVVTAICPHISSLRTLVLPGDAPLRLQVWTLETAVATVDGQVDRPLADGSVVEVRRSDCVTVFARRGTPADFYSRVLSKLG